MLNSNLSFSVKQRPINKQRKKIMSKTHIPITGSLQRIVLEKLIENGEAGVTFLDFPKDSGITEDLLDEIMESLGSGDFEVEATH